jgi:hypothetical protein
MGQELSYSYYALNHTANSTISATRLTHLTVGRGRLSGPDSIPQTSNAPEIAMGSINLVYLETWSF